MTFYKKHYALIASLYFIVIILIAHYFATPDYEWTKHTISHLGCQNYNNKWIMQFGFIGFGGIVSFGVLANGISLRTLLILIYGLSIAFTGVFCAEPFFETPLYSIQQAQLHSIFAQIAGFSFSLAILVQLFYTSSIKLKSIHFFFFLLVIASSVSFAFLINEQGIAQRMMYLISLIWFSVFFKTH